MHIRNAFCVVLLVSSVLQAQDVDIAAQVDSAFADAVRAHDAALAEWQVLQNSLKQIRAQIPELQAKAAALQERKPTLPVFDKRTWQTLDKKFSTTGTLVDTDGAKVLLRKADGTNASVQKEILIAADRIYIDKCHEELSASKGLLKEWNTEYETFVAKLETAVNNAKSASQPKPTPPNKDEIAVQVERSMRGIEAQPVIDSPGIFRAKLGIGEIEIRLPSPIIWLAKGSQQHDSGGFCTVSIVSDSKAVYEDHGVLNVFGRPIVVVKSAGTEHFEIEPTAKLGDWHTFKAPGKTHMRLQVGDERAWVPFEIRELPYPTGTQSSEILKEIGFPKSKDTHYTSWPDTKTFDGLIYSPSAGESIIAAEHWKFDSLPFAVLAIVDDRLDDVGSYVPRGR